MAGWLGRGVGVGAGVEGFFFFFLAVKYSGGEVT